VSVAIKNFLKARRDRCLGSILGYTEREIFPRLTAQERLAFRNLVLDSLNSYHDSVLDLVKSDQGTVRNEELISMLERLEAHLQQRTPVSFSEE
jgi:CHASE3 domain sensor protein